MADKLIAEFAVLGKPEPRGSKDAFPLYRAPRHLKRPVRRSGGKVTCHACGETDGAVIVNVSDSNPKSDKWMEEVAGAAAATFRGRPAGECALRVEFDFYVTRPQDQWSGHLLKDVAPAYPITRPDLLKFARAVEDALSGVVWVDDAQIVDEHIREFYAVPSERGEGIGVIVRVWVLETQIAQQLPLEERTRVMPDREAEQDDSAQLAIA